MTRRFSPDTNLADLIGRHPQTVLVLKRFGIAPGSTKWALAQACREHRVSYAQVALALSVALAPALEPDDWPRRPLADQTRHATTFFHEPLRAELCSSQRTASRVQGHGNTHRRALAVILQELTRLRRECEAHMAAEERELFPLIDTLAGDSVAEESRARFVHLRAVVEAEHVDAGQTLRIIQQVTDGYRPPAGACSTVHDLYRGLEELQDLERRHAAFEQDVLFPTAWSRIAS